MEFILFQPVGLPTGKETAEKWKKTIEKPNLDIIEKPMSRKKKVSQTSTKKNPPIKIAKETLNQQPKKESFARKTSRIETKENTAEKLEDKQEMKDDNGNIDNESNNNQHIDENNDYESEETNSLSEESEMN